MNNKLHRHFKEFSHSYNPSLSVCMCCSHNRLHDLSPLTRWHVQPEPAAEAPTQTSQRVGSRVAGQRPKEGSSVLQPLRKDLQMKKDKQLERVWINEQQVQNHLNWHKAAEMQKRIVKRKPPQTSENNHIGKIKKYDADSRSTWLKLKDDWSLILVKTSNQDESNTAAKQLHLRAVITRFEAFKSPLRP